MSFPKTDAALQRQPLVQVRNTLARTLRRHRGQLSIAHTYRLPASEMAGAGPYGYSPRGAGGAVRLGNGRPRDHHSPNQCVLATCAASSVSPSTQARSSWRRSRWWSPSSAKRCFLMYCRKSRMASKTALEPASVTAISPSSSRAKCGLADARERPRMATAPLWMDAGRTGRIAAYCSAGRVGTAPTYSGPARAPLLLPAALWRGHSQRGASTYAENR
mmetsp:Transcript_44217/g.112878  ORF Transcript_44217/g.112878 Transcript_44217/m.112878 type:complete len:218 (+) Transcript_44217:175-828(+)